MSGRTSETIIKVTWFKVGEALRKSLQCTKLYGKVRITLAYTDAVTYSNTPLRGTICSPDMGKNTSDTKLQNSFIRAINEASPDGIVVVNDNGIIVSHNRKFIEMWGVTHEHQASMETGAAVGMEYLSVLSAAVDRVVEHETFLSKVKRVIESPRSNEQCEVSLSDGRTIEGHTTVLHSDDGQYLGRVWFYRDITDRKRAEEKLQITQFVSDHAPDNIMWIDEQARIVYVNEATSLYYGYEKDVLLAKTIFDIDPDSNPRMWPRHWKALKLRGVLTFESTHMRSDGGVFPVEISANYVEFGGRELNVAFIRDVTERKQEMHKLLITQFVSDQAPDDIIWVDKDARIVYANEAACREYGYTREEMLELDVTDINPAATPENWLKQWQKLKQARHLNFEAEHRRRDGTTFPIEISANYVMFEGVELNVAFMKDITERRQQQTSLEVSRERFEKLFEYSSDGMFILDMNGNFIDINRTAHESLGYTKEEMLSMKLTELDPPEFAARVPERILQIKTHGLAVFETAHYRKDGSIMPVEIKARVIELGGEQVLFSVIRDITERKKAETEMLIAAVAFESQEMLVITDANGVILRVNQAFVENTGFTPGEAIGNTPRILKSGRHDAVFYREMWNTLKETGTWQGEVWDRRKNGEIYPKWLTISAVKDKNGIVTHYVGSHIDITERKAAEEKIKHLAFYDPLTHLPNRRLLMDRLQQAMSASARNNRKAALLFIDLDHFKTLNDTQGHDIGDMLLQQVSKRLEGCVRDGDTVARLGGDEFMLILEGLSKRSSEAAAQTESIGEKILLSLSQPYKLGTYECHSTPSIGATIFEGHQSTLEELIKQADIAMYQSKKAGRDTLRFFDPKMQEAINEHAAMERELRQAIEEHQFQLHYQLQVDSAGQQLGAEALIRWIHPKRGIVSPAQFIPLAEETGLILQIGQWVLETACAQLKSWQQDPSARDLVMSVNVSAKRFHQADFVEQVRAAIRHHGIDPKLVKLELTESMLLEDIEDTIETMNALNELGVSLALDDFGTGYSSLQYLKRLPLDQLKIDQSFVRDLATDSNDSAIVRTIIAMAQSMNLDVIAEGVETEKQREILLEMGCQHFQGYLFARPVPIEQFAQLLKGS